MRASKVIEILQRELDAKDEHIERLMQDNLRLLRALMDSEGKAVAAAALRPMRDPNGLDSQKAPVPRVIGL